MADRDDRRDRGDRDRGRRREPRFLITDFQVSDPTKEGDSWNLNAVAVAVFRDERGDHPPNPQRNIVFDVGGFDIGTPQPTGRSNGRASMDFTLSEPGSCLVGAYIEGMPATRITQKVVIKAERPKTPEEQELARTKTLVEKIKAEGELEELRQLAGPKLELEQAKLARGVEEISEKKKTPEERAAAAARAKLEQAKAEGDLTELNQLTEIRIQLEQAKADAEHKKLQGLTGLELELAQADLTEKLGEARTRQIEKDIALAEAKKRQGTLAEDPPPQLAKISALLNDDVSFVVTLLRTKKGKPEEGQVFYTDPDPREERTDQNGIAKVVLDLRPRARKVVFFLPENPNVMIEETVPVKPFRARPAEGDRAEPQPEPKPDKPKPSPFLDAFKRGQKIGQSWFGKED